MNCKIFLLAALALAPFAELVTAQDAAPSAPLPASSFTVLDKLKYRAAETFGPLTIVKVAGFAGYDQWTYYPREWGQGAEAYGKRFASEYGYVVVRQSLASGLEASSHQDPRYFPTSKKGFFKRTESALVQTFIARPDSGRAQFAWSRIGSAAGSAAIGNLWQPPSTRTAGNTVELFGLMLGGDAAYNWIQEFIPVFRPRSTRRY